MVKLPVGTRTEIQQPITAMNTEINTDIPYEPAREIPYADYGFKNTGFGATVRECQIHVGIVVSSYASRSAEPFGVYICHGAPGGAYWKNSAPLVRCRTMAEAQEKARVIYGITGSEQFATVVYL